MKLKTFTLQLDTETGTFDDAALVAFLADRDAVAVDEHFFVHDGLPRWALLVHYREGIRRDSGGRASDQRPDWRDDLSAEEAAVFSALRSWRNNRARRDGRPAFVLFTNRQLAAIAKLQPKTLAELATVDGVGEARVRDYGESVLAVVGGIDSAQVEAAAPPAKASSPDEETA